MDEKSECGRLNEKPLKSSARKPQSYSRHLDCNERRVRGTRIMFDGHSGNIPKDHIFSRRDHLGTFTLVALENIGDKLPFDNRGNAS